MDVLEAIETRHSIRSFKPDPVPEEILLRILDAARKAPSSHNLQPWEYIVVTDPEMRQKLCVAANNQAHVAQAPATIVCLGSMRQQDALADRLEARIRPDAAPEQIERAMRYAQRMRTDEALRLDHVRTNTFIGTAFLVLAAQQFGLGTIWMGGFQPDKVKELFGVPDDFLVVSLVSIGWPAETGAVRTRIRRPLEEIVHFERFGEKRLEPAWRRA